MHQHNLRGTLSAIRSVLSAGLACAAIAACGGGSGAATQESSRASVPSPSATPTLARWTPRTGDTWQWQLHGNINTAYAVSVYDVDLFDAPQTTIASLKSQGKRVVCYFSAGSSENWRSDFGRFAASDMGSALVGWPGERWLDTRSSNVRAVLADRLNLAATKGCDGVEPDNVEGYATTTGFALTAQTQLDFNTFLADQAHSRGLAIGLKNDIQQIDSLVAQFDFAVNEECFQKNECVGYSAFTAQGKPVFNAEYAQQYVTNTANARDALCAAAKASNIRALVLPLALDDSLRYSCD